MLGSLRSPLGLSLLLCLAGLSLAPRCGGPKPPPPWGQELLANRGFEDGVLGPWQVDTGSCEVEYGPTFPWSDAFAGDYLFYGGDDGTVASCRAAQELNLISLNFRGTHLDTSQVGADLSAVMRSWENPGTFDDQVFVRVRYLDAAFQETGSLRTLMVGDDEWVQRAASGIVPAGTRALRVELESRFRTGADNDGMVDETSFVLNQVTASPTSFTKQPVLSGAEPDSMTVMWETVTNQVEHSVDWALAGSPVFTDTVTSVETTVIDTSHYVHKAVIQGLSPETAYRYRVNSGGLVSASFEFTTAPAPTSPFRVAWFSDNQNGPGVFQGLLALMNARDPDLAIVPGDMVQNGNQLGEWQSHWFDPLANTLFGQTVPQLIARGNHDGEHPYAYAYTAVPGNESWYSFTYGNTFFVALDTEAPVSGTGGDSDPLVFLQSELASPEALAAEFRVVYFHKPPYTNLWDATNVLACLFGAEYDGEPGVRSSWVPVFESNAVDLVVSGHTHSYQHGLQNGVHYLMVGGAGGAIDDTRGCFGSTFWSLIDREESVHGYSLMDVDDNVLTWTAYADNDGQLHTFQIVH